MRPVHTSRPRRSRRGELVRVAGVKTIEGANEYLTNHDLVCWELEMTVEPANVDDAHCSLEKAHALSHRPQMSSGRLILDRVARFYVALTYGANRSRPEKSSAIIVLVLRHLSIVRDRC
jgi:hypothetical protein